MSPFKSTCFIESQSTTVYLNVMVGFNTYMKAAMFTV